MAATLRAISLSAAVCGSLCLSFIHPETQAGCRFFHNGVTTFDPKSSSWCDRSTKLRLYFPDFDDGAVTGTDSGSRRDFFSYVTSSSVLLSLVTLTYPPPSFATEVSADDAAAAAASSSVDYRAVASDVDDLISKVPYRGPPLVRLAWHSSGTYDRITKTGGSGGGTIRFPEELAHKENAGLGQTAVKWLEPIKAKYGDGLSYADLYTLAGVVAIKSMGGPSIPWSFGRIDAPTPSSIPPDGRLPTAESGPPGADKSDSVHLRKVFYRMGFSDREIVALSGAHSLGRCNTYASGYDGTWTPNPTQFDNSYFALLYGLRWKERDWTGPFQYEAKFPADSKGGVGGRRKTLMMLPTDLVLVRDPSFRRYVRLYAQNEHRFKKDFAAAFQKLEELGTEGLTPVDLWS